MLKGRRILVLQSEYLIALDLQAMFEAEGAVVSVSTKAEHWTSWECIVIDSLAANQLITARMAALGVPIVLYTGSMEIARQRYPDAIIVAKPSTREQLIAAVARALRPRTVQNALSA